MKACIRGLLALALLVGLTLAQAQNRSAEEAVSTYIDRLLSRIETIQPLYESDRPRYFEEVEAALADFVDFREVARGVMAKYSVGPRGASAAQLDRFAEVFRDSMVEFYGSALAAYGGQGYEILPPRSAPEDPASATPVRMTVAGEDGGRIELQYTMFLDEAGQWKLKNLYVEGVNLRRQYHSRFDDLMKRHDYDIDAVIDDWQL